MTALASSLAFLYAIRKLPPGSKIQQRLFLVAAGLSVAIMPFTLGVMKRTNDELHRRADEARDEISEAKIDAKKGSIESYPTHDLIRWWAKLNIM